MEENNVNVEYTSATEEVLCPGKEIAILVCGIHALVFAVLAAMFCWAPVSGLMFLAIYGLFSVGCIIPTKILYKDVKNIATSIGKKAEVGNKLAKAAIIVLIVAAAISLIVAIVAIVIYGGMLGIGIWSSINSMSSILINI